MESLLWYQRTDVGVRVKDAGRGKREGEEEGLGRDGADIARDPSTRKGLVTRAGLSPTGTPRLGPARPAGRPA